MRIVVPLDCLCGCGQRVYRAKFVPGHDQVALHQCISQIGSIADFVEWFGEQMNGGSDAKRATVIRGEGMIDLTVRQEGRIELRWTLVKLIERAFETLS